MNETHGSQKSRREFLHSSASVAAGGVLASQIGFPAVVYGSGQSQTLKVGLIGCGGRGSGAVLNALKADSNIELSAMGDLFKNNIESSLRSLQKAIPDKIKVPANQQFVGFDAYQQVINSDVDIVLLATPPGFRPLHLKSAIEGGKHAFVEITAAIDGPGVRSVLKSAELAERKGLAIVSGFCWRYNDSMRAVAEQIKAGAIGEVRALYATYYRNSLDHKYHGKRTPEMSDLEWQIRDWYNYLWLSGDVTIVLSGGHSVDKMSWWVDDMMPTAAVALGSRAIPAEGNTFDNGFVVYEYANGIRGFLGCRSQDGCYSANGDYIIGSKGICKIGRTPVIEGETNWRYQGKKNNMYQTEHDDFIASIRAGKPINDGTRMAHTSLMAILGRMAAYTGKRITWEQALNSQQKLVPDELDWNSKIDETPRAVPGITRFI
ncbi:MAG: Gfo/Idh/MocA family oxidoreductase [Gimesia sp.]|nr:Gfo/Idh/MocA family oxidoreductase [Gimesia sp.]